MSYIGNEPIVSATRTITEITATAGQTVFVANGGYTVGYIDVFVNGAQLQTSDFTATDGSTITLVAGASAGDDIRLVAWGTFQSANAVLLTGNSNLTGNLNVSDKLGIGNTNPAYRVDISAGETTNGYAQRIRSNATAGKARFQFTNNAVTQENAWFESGDSQYLALGTGANERMRIDSVGRVTAPYQPAFHVKLNSGTQYSTAGTIPFTQVLTNIGSYYNTSTYRFTAPVAGTYIFFVKAFIEVAGRTYINIAVNGVTRQGMYGPQGQGDILNAQLIYTLAANDYVTASLGGGIIFGDGGSNNYDAATFSGFLIG